MWQGHPFSNKLIQALNFKGIYISELRQPNPTPAGIAELYSASFYILQPSHENLCI
jgi:hypothetical protein